MELNEKFLNNPFLLSDNEQSNISFLGSSKVLNDTIFHYSNDTQFYNLHLDDIEIILVGYILDIRDDSKNGDDILKKLAFAYKSSLDLFLNDYEYMNGRFVLILSSPNDTLLFSDATSMLPIFNYKNKYFSSHEIILKEYVKIALGIELNQYGFNMKNFLDYTNTKEIFSFNPNLMYSFRNNSFKRIFPRGNQKNLPLEYVIEKTEAYLKTQINWLNNHYDKIYLSLTGGFDSKVSLALVRPIIDKVFTFTYMYKFDENTNYEELGNFKKIYYKDNVIVNNLVENFRLNNHKYYFFSDYKAPAKYLQTLGKHVSSHHSYGLSYIINKEFDRSSSIHLKSTLYELAKLSFKDVNDDESILNDIKHWAPRELHGQKEILMNMFKEYKKRNYTDEIFNFGHNIQTMLYWEFRMGNWHSNITQETDFTIDTYILINNRYMIKQFISLNKKDKKKKSLLTTIVKNNWPALNYFIANSFDTLEDRI